MTPLDTALLAAIIDDPDSDELRGVAADWWEERGELDRAEFVRVQVNIARMNEAGEGKIDSYKGHTCVEHPCPACTLVAKYKSLCNRQELLFDRFGLIKERALQFGMPVWCYLHDYLNYKPSQIWRSHGLVRRGFVEAITLTAADWLAHADALISAAALRAVTLTTWPTGKDCIYIKDAWEVGIAGRVVEIKPPPNASIHTITNWRVNGLWVPEYVQVLLDARWPRIKFTLPNGIVSFS